MVHIRTPERYYQEPDLLARSGSLIAPLGRNALLIGGVKALKAARAALLSSLDNEGISYEILEFGGKVTEKEIEGFTAAALDRKPEVLIGVGGGKALDLTKAVGGRLRLPVVAVPTVAATCASWAAVSVLYDDQGRSSSYLLNDRSPALVLADARILAAAPRRYLASGIGDTIVKWYETSVNLSDGPEGLDIRISTDTAKLALERLRRFSLDAYDTAGTGQVTPAFTETVDAVIALAGLAGSIQGATARAAVAHSIHNSLTYLPETAGTLHGEKVAFGLLAQVILQGSTEPDIRRLALWLHQLGLPVTLKQLGIHRAPSAAAAEIASRVQIPEQAAAGLSFGVHPSLIAQAIEQADQWGYRIQLEAFAEL